VSGRVGDQAAGRVLGAAHTALQDSSLDMPPNMLFSTKINRLALTHGALEGGRQFEEGAWFVKGVVQRQPATTCATGVACLIQASLLQVQPHIPVTRMGAVLLLQRLLQGGLALPLGGAPQGVAGVPWSCREEEEEGAVISCV
jgi:hypothetical protein